MKIQSKTVFPVMAVLAIVMTLAIQPAFAENASVSIAAGASTPGCETTNECFIPDQVTINVGDTVTWSNDDTAAHTVTAGTAADGPSGVFDSSLFMAGTTFSYTFDTAGEFPYFCMVHPWMSGTVTVQAAGEGETPTEESQEGQEGTETPTPAPTVTLQPDQIMADFTTSGGEANKPMSIDLTLTDLDGNNIEHITYHIKATQGSKVLLDEDGHMHMGVKTNTHTTQPLPVAASDTMPVVVTVQLVGFGHGDQYVPVSGEIATKKVVPEFGTIATMILAVAIISIIAVSAKSKLSVVPRL